MKLILIDGGPASGKNTLGTLLVKKLNKHENKVILFDLDTFVEQINPSWIWKSKLLEEADQSKARKNIANAINKYLLEDYTIIVIGERFLSKSDISLFVSRLNINCPTQLYHLSVPLTLRRKRLHKRGPHSLIDLEKDQKERDMILSWPGYIYPNIDTPDHDADNLVKLIQDSKGTIDMILRDN